MKKKIEEVRTSGNAFDLARRTADVLEEMAADIAKLKAGSKKNPKLKAKAKVKLPAAK